MSEEQEQTTHVTESNGPRTQGRVKWFNNKAGYGFITSSSGENEGEDIFVHHSALITCAEQYKYLVAGEYVEFCRCETNDEAHKWQAGDVKGVSGGKLMCETRNDNRSVRTSGGRTEQRDVDGSQPRHRRPYRTASDGASQQNRYRGGGPRGPQRTLVDEAGVEWELVRRRGQQGRGRRFNPNDEDA